MNRQKNGNRVLAVVTAAAFLMTGCQSGSGSSAETEALKEQIARLEQQISDLEQKQAAENAASADRMALSGDNAQEQSDTASNDNAQPALDGDNAQNQTDGRTQNQTGAADSLQPQNDTSVGSVPVSRHDEEAYHNPSHAAINDDASDHQGADGLTTYTMEELGVMVNGFVEKAGTAVPGGTAAEDMEQFFALKQEAKQIDDLLDSHEDELEYLYKYQSLTRDDYKRMERELELLEDKLDAAEDQLEYVFGIND